MKKKNRVMHSWVDEDKPRKSKVTLKSPIKMQTWGDEDYECPDCGSMLDDDGLCPECDSDQ